MILIGVCLLIRQWGKLYCGCRPWAGTGNCNALYSQWEFSYLKNESLSRAVATSTIGLISTAPIFETTTTFCQYSRIWRPTRQTEIRPRGHSWQSRDQWMQIVWKWHFLDFKPQRCHQKWRWKNMPLPLAASPPYCKVCQCAHFIMLMSCTV